jgi:peptide/nickel transport system permease protein
VSFLIFFLVHLIPGDIVDAIRAQVAAGEVGAFNREAWERQLGIDAPLAVQYLRWLGFHPQNDGNFKGIIQGDLGVSWWRQDPVLNLIGVRWPVTLELGFMGVITALLIALPIGIFSAVRQDTAADYLGRSFAILCISVPYFWLGTIAIIFPALWWGYMPPLNIIPFIEDPAGNLRMFIVPAIILGMLLSGITMRMSRTMMLEVLRQDYIRTAWAKGLRERVIIIGHALKNAMIPVVTTVALQLHHMIGGTVIIEQIFVLPGMGRLLIDAVNQRDRPLVSGIVLFYAFALILINLVTDLAYGYLDPRVKYK